MQSVSKCVSGHASYAQLRQRTKWGLDCSIFLMALFTQMVSMVWSGYFAPNAKTHIMSVVSAPTNQNQQDGPLCAGFWSVNNKQVEVDLPKSWAKQIISKWVTISVAVVKQKQGKHRPKKQERRGINGSHIGIWQKASSGEGKKEHQWSEKDLDRAFDLWDANEGKPPPQSKRYMKCMWEWHGYGLILTDLHERRHKKMKQEVCFRHLYMCIYLCNPYIKAYQVLGM